MTTLTVLFVSCFIGMVTARSDGDIKKWFVQQALDCSKEHPVSAEEIQMIKNHKIPTSKNAKCLLACMFRRLDWIDEKGMFLEQNAYKLSEKEYPGDQTKLDNAKTLYGICTKVNEKHLDDDKGGCERSVLLAKCLVENSTKMGFV